MAITAIVGEVSMRSIYVFIWRSSSVNYYSLTTFISTA